MKHKWISVLVSLAIALSIWGLMPAGTAWAATCNWTGNVSTDWAIAGNWDCGVVPGSSDIALIGPSTNNPVISANATVGTITINSGGLLTYSAATGVTLSVTTFNINDGGTYIHNRAAVLPLTATNRNFTANSTVEIQNLSAPASALPVFGNLIVNSTATIQMSGYLATVNGNLTKLNTGELRLATTQSVSLTIGGNLDIQNESLTFQSSSTTNSVTVAVNGNLSVSSGGTLQSGSGTGVHQVNVMGNWTNNGAITLNSTAGTGVTFNGTNEQNISGTSATAFRNLLVASGAKVVLPINATATALTNNGTITQTQTVNGNADVTFVGTGGYGGVVLNANNADLGSTTVAIRGNQNCDTNNASVRRCFNITPATTTGRNATITFFFAAGELGTQTCANLRVWRWTGSAWASAGTSAAPNCVSTPNSIQVTGVSSFSPFALSSDPSGPTAITLRSFTADGSSLKSIAVFTVLVVAMLAMLAITLHRRSRAA
jgi:hypothetical protein